MCAEQLPDCCLFFFHLLRRNFFRVQDGDHLRQQNAAENCIQIFFLTAFGRFGQDGHFQAVGCVFQLIGTTLFAVKGHGIRSIRHLFNIRVGKSTADAVYGFFPAHSFRQRQLASVMRRAIDFFIGIIPEAEVDHCGDQKPQKDGYRSGTGCNTCHNANNKPQQQPDL